MADMATCTVEDAYMVLIIVMKRASAEREAGMGTAAHKMQKRTQIITHVWYNLRVDGAHDV
jgi:hypothetical protein